MLSHLKKVKNNKSVYIQLPTIRHRFGEKIMTEIMAGEKNDQPTWLSLEAKEDYGFREREVRVVCL